MYEKILPFSSGKRFLPIFIMDNMKCVEKHLASMLNGEILSCSNFDSLRKSYKFCMGLVTFTS